MVSGAIVNSHAGSKNTLYELCDDLLVQAAKSGDGLAFTELARRHSTMIQRKIHRIVGNWEDAEDVVQESLLRAFMHFNSFQGRCNVSTWLTRIAVNSAFMMLRKRRVRLEVSVVNLDATSGSWETWEVPDLSPSPERLYVGRETAALVQDAIHRLPWSYRAAVELYQTGDCSIREIAQTLGITVAAAKSRLSRARDTLRATFLDGSLSSERNDGFRRLIRLASRSRHIASCSYKRVNKQKAPSKTSQLEAEPI